MEGMDNTPATTAPTPTELVAAFDEETFLTDTIGLVVAQAITALKTPGLVEASEVGAIVTRHLAPVLGRTVDAPIAKALGEISAAAHLTAAKNAEALSDPRYVDAPAVTAKLALQRRVHRFYDETVKVIDVELPAGWLARQERADLQGTAADGDTTWIVEDLELYGTHHGPSELIINQDGPTGENLLALWLEATELKS